MFDYTLALVQLTKEEELKQIKKLIEKKTNRLNYIKNRDKILQKQKARQATLPKRKWSERSDNPMNKVKLCCPYGHFELQYVNGNQNSKTYHCKKCSVIFSIKAIKHV